MKPKRIKITDTTLLVYKSSKASKTSTDTDPPTDPTTTMITITKTGLFAGA